MEDSHIAECNLEGNVSIFGVFDGHGGAEVALFVKKYFINEIKQNLNFK
jgi:protein phosphatase 1G